MQTISCRGDGRVHNLVLTGAVVSLVNPTIVQNEGDGDVSVCARLDSPAGGVERDIFIALNNSELIFDSTLCLRLFYFSLFIDDFNFPSNSRVGATQCLTIPVTNDNVYQTSPVLMETVTLSKSLMVTNQGRLNLTNTVAMVTINDNDGETKKQPMIWCFFVIAIIRCCCLHGYCYHDNYRGWCG